MIALRLAAHAQYGLTQHFGIGLMYAECILATNRNEVMAELELLEQAHREKFELIGAD
jgi:hypothetical protein